MNTFKKIHLRLLNFFRLRHLKTDVFLVVVFLINIILWSSHTSKIKYEFTITPYPPSKLQKMLMSLGDEAFLYRFLGTRLQFAGDTYGDTTPLKNYD